MRSRSAGVSLIRKGLSLVSGFGLGFAGFMVLHGSYCEATNQPRCGYKVVDLWLPCSYTVAMQRLSPEKRTQVISALCEGCSINSTVRMTGVAKTTILRLLLDLGRVCMEWEDSRLRGLFCARIEADEIWGFNHCKARMVPHAKARVDAMGSVWTWFAMDAESKLIISWIMGDRDAGHASALMHDLASRLVARPELTTDSLGAYSDAVFDAFSRLGVDYAQIHKSYGRLSDEGHHYSPPQCTGCEKRSVFGSPRLERVGTSYIERANLTVRMGQRRWTRLTNAHSKKIDNMQAAFALFSCHYNWARKHASLGGRTPAMAQGLTDRAWTVADIVGLLDAAERKVIGTNANKRGPYKPRRKSAD